MAKTNNNYSGLVKTLTTKNSSGTQGEPSLRAGKSGGVQSASLNGKNLSTGISFGKVRTTKAPVSTGTDWTKFLEQAASGGVASAFSGSFGLGDVTGIVGSLVSGISGLLGGNKKSPAPLVAFQLPASQHQTITVGGNGASGTGQTSVSMQDQSVQIAQAVKTALLHSSSLNDVISEI